MTKDERLVMAAIAETPNAYGITIQAHVQKALGPIRWLGIPASWRFGMGRLYVALQRLESRGYITSEWSLERFPERGGHRRRYYRIAQPPRKIGA